MTNGRTSDRSTAVTWASRLVVSFGALVAVNWLVAVVRDVGTTGADLSFTVLLLIAAGVSGYGLRRLERWALFSSLALAVGGLFFVAPVAGTILLGGGTDPVGTGWDVVFFPLVAAILVALLGFLRLAWREIRTASVTGHD